MVSSAIFKFMIVSLQYLQGNFPDSLKQRLQAHFLRKKETRVSNLRTEILLNSCEAFLTRICFFKLNIDCIPQITALLN